MRANFSNLKITGIAACLPKNKLELSTLGERFGENETQRIIASTGIKCVRVAPSHMTSSDLCFEATKNLCDSLNINRESIDAVIFVSQTPDKIAPATSAILQHRLGLSRESLAFDINYGCSGYIYGLYQASILIASGNCHRVLICAGDVITKLLDPNDKQVRMVLSDAGSATLIERGNENISIILKTDGSGADYLTATRNGYFHMDGAKVMEFALREVPTVIDEMLSIKNWHKEEVGAFVLHQPNKFMLNYLRKKIKVTEKSFPIDVENVGNTGPASIPLLLSMKGKELKDNNQLNKVVLCGFGVGLSWGSIGLSLDSTQFLLPIEI
jgi:3-oxoacyl-[acyl-carrier-protein] synthase-3